MLASSTPPLSCLIRHGFTLAELIRIKSKLRQNSNHPSHNHFHEKVRGVVDQFLEELNQGQASYVDESMLKVITKIEELVQEFAKVDNVHGEFYDNLTNKLKPFKARWEQQSSAVAFSSVQAASPNEHQPISDANLEEESSFEARYGKLTENERYCLFYFCLFPDEVGVKKRDLFYCWLGMELIIPGTDGGKAASEQVLAKLVAEGLVIGSAKSRLCSRYRINAGFCSKLKQAIKDKGSTCLTAAKEQSFSTIRRQGDNESERKEPGNVVALLHTNEERLDAKTFGWLSKMSNAKVVHLGSWRGDLSNMNATIVEDIEVLKVLKNLFEVRFLSLGGISGIVSLPDSICKLVALEILDMRACNNLESLPTGIGSLQRLRQLDMSECYLLDQIPKAIATLSNLVVLKGFVIKQDQDSKNGSNGSRKTNTSSCVLRNLVELKQLRKLSIRARRMNFPTREDLQTLCEMQLTKLGIAWVGNSGDAQTDSDLEKFPKTVEKLELETAPRRAASRLLELISMQRGNRLEKLYIKGGGMKELDPMKHNLAHVKRVRLRYLSKFDVEWYQFKQSFPSLVHLQLFKCPNLVFFPCDENGIWED